MNDRLRTDEEIALVSLDLKNLARKKYRIEGDSVKETLNDCVGKMIIEKFVQDVRGRIEEFTPEQLFTLHQFIEESHPSQVKEVEKPKMAAKAQPVKSPRNAH